jgi:signal transduction histidine kinase
MTARKYKQLQVLCTVLIALGVSLAYVAGILEPFELLLLDARSRLAPAPPVEQPVVVVGVTKGDTPWEGLGEFPWPRRVHAQLIDTLILHGARVIALDFHFESESKEAGDDRALQDACRKAGNVILPVYTAKTRGMPVVRVEGMPVWQAKGPYTLERSFEALRKAVNKEAHINVRPDRDDRIRRIPAFLLYNDSVLVPALSLQAFLAAERIDANRMHWQQGRLRLRDLPLPLDRQGAFYIRHPDYERDVGRVLDSEVGRVRSCRRLQGKPILHYSFRQVLQGSLAPGEFAGRIVLVGYTDVTKARDVHPTPFGRQFGVLVQAAAVQTLLSGRPIARVAPGWTLALVASLSLAMLPFLLRLRLLHVAGAGAGALVLTLAATMLLFVSSRLIMDGVPALAVVTLNAASGIAVTALYTRRAVRERDLQFQAVEEWGRTATAGAPNVEDVLLSMAARALGARAGIFLAASGGGAPGAPRGHFGLEPEGRLAAARAAAAALARETGGDRLALSAEPAVDDRLPAAGTRFANILCMPLASPEGALGYLCLFDKEPSPVSPRAVFGREDLRLAEALCRQASVAVHNARLAGELQRKNEALSRAMDDLREAQQALLQSERLSALGKMTNMIVHDIKNPMQGIRTFAELVGNPQTTPEELSEFSALICSEIDRLVDMSQELLDYSRGAVQLQRERIAVARLLEDVQKTLGGVTEPKSIRVDARLGYDGEAVWDAGRMKRVLLNLCVNAAEAMPPGGTLCIATTADDRRLTLTVTDTGPGIPQEFLERVFEPFATSGKAGGTGLGLAIARKIVEDHGGTIAARNRQEGGAEFRIEIPLDSPAEEGAASP